MRVPEEIAYDCEDCTEDLDGDVPPVLGYLWGEWKLALSGQRQFESEEGDGRTPSTMPVGKMIPQARIWIMIWTHSIVSRGSALTASPSGISDSSCSCAKATAAKATMARSFSTAPSSLERAILKVYSSPRPRFRGRPLPMLYQSRQVPFVAYQHNFYLLIYATWIFL